MKPAQVYPVYPERSRRGFVQILIIVVVVLLIGVVGILAYYNFRNPQAPNDWPEASSSPKPSADETANPDSIGADWKTYTNSKYSFSISYPSDWLVIGDSPSQGEYQTIYLRTKKSGSLIMLYLPENPDSQDLKVNVIKTEVINLGEQPTNFKYFITTVTGDLDAYSYDNSRKPFNLINFSLGNEPINQEKDLITIKEILASYKIFK